MPIPSIERERLERRFSDSDVEYWKVEPDGAMKMVFRKPEFCRECFQGKNCFIMRANGMAMCTDRDSRIEA